MRGRSSARSNRRTPPVELKSRSVSMITKSNYNFNTSNNIEDLDVEVGDTSTKSGLNEFEEDLIGSNNHENDDEDAVEDEEVTPSSTIQRVNTPNTTLRRARSSFIKRQNLLFKSYEEVTQF